MKSKMKRLFFSLAWGSLGILLLVVVLRSATSRVLANGVGEPLAQPKVESALRGVSNWRTVMRDSLDGTLTGTLYLPLAYSWRPTFIYVPYLGSERPAYMDDFSDPDSGWPTWEKKTDNEDHRGGYLVERGRAQLMAELLKGRAPTALESRMMAESDEVFYAVVHDAWDEVFISGPFQVTGDFVYEVQARYDWVEEWHGGNRYGILISEEQVDPSDAHTVHGYSFQVQINPTDDGHAFDTAEYQIKRWSYTDWDGEEEGGDNDKNLRSLHPSSAIRSGEGDWNKLRLEREGSLLRVYVNDTYLDEVDDDKYTGPMYIGFWCRHTGSGSYELSYDVLFEWDDVLVEPY